MTDVPDIFLFNFNFSFVHCHISYAQEEMLTTHYKNNNKHSHLSALEPVEVSSANAELYICEEINFIRIVKAKIIVFYLVKTSTVVSLRLLFEKSLSFVSRFWLTAGKSGNGTIAFYVKWHAVMRSTLLINEEKLLLFFASVAMLSVVVRMKDFDGRQTSKPKPLYH